MGRAKKCNGVETRRVTWYFGGEKKNNKTHTHIDTGNKTSKTHKQNKPCKKNNTHKQWTDRTLARNVQRKQNTRQKPTKKHTHKTEQHIQAFMTFSSNHILTTTHHIHYSTHPNNAQTGHNTHTHKHTPTNQWNSNFGCHPRGVNRILRLLIGWWDFLFFKNCEPMKSRDGSVNGEYVYGDPKCLSI